MSQGVKLQVSPTQDAYLFDVHLAPYPYQPYDIRDGLVTTEAQAIARAQSARGAAMATVLDGMSEAFESGSPVFLVGDFNEPSHLDWTAEAATAGKHFGMKVNWPASNAVVSAGMSDAFRQLRPDEINDPGDTWTTGYPAPSTDPEEVHDRIDFVYYAGTNVLPTLAKTIGYNASDGSTDIAIQPYPSDHRAVYVDFTLPTPGDVNGDGVLKVDDWIQFRGGQHTNMTGLTLTQAFALGDLNRDLQNNHTDFTIFKGAYDKTYGAGAFVAMLAAVPEPASVTLASWVLATAALTTRRRRP